MDEIINDSYKNLKIGVIGNGSWATALVKIFQERVSIDPRSMKKFNTVNWFIRNNETAKYIKQHKTNPKYLTSVKLNTNKIKLYINLNEFISNTDLIILCVPSAFIHNLLESNNANFNGKIVVSAIKGIIPEYNMVVCDYLKKRHGIDKVGAIVGPCHAEEIAMERLSYITIASENLDLAKYLALRISCQYVKASINTDLFGTEYASVLKNIYAIAVGLAHGSRFGDNFIAVLVTNSIMEMDRFIKVVQPMENRNFHSTAYLGDLLVTCYSKFSRNRTFGNMIGKGYSVHTAQAEMDMIAEGYFAIKCVKEIVSKHNIHTPIIDFVYNVLYKKLSPSTGLRDLKENLK